MTAETTRALAWALNRSMVLAENEEAGTEDFKSAWDGNREQLMRMGRQIFSSLEYQGFTITAPETVSEED